jgi:hypothetical protein
MDVLPPFIEVIGATGERCSPRKTLQRVDSPEAWQEKDWDRIIIENVELLAACLREAGVLSDDATLKVLGAQVDNIDIVLAEVGIAAEDDLRRLVLVEDKLLSNPQAKRHVLAQILDYARVVQDDWPTANLLDKLSDDTQWVSANHEGIKRASRNADLLLLVVGDGIDEGMERLARRFAKNNDPFSLSELALVSMPLYAMDDQYFLVPHVVSAVRCSAKEMTIRVVVQDIAGREVPAEVGLALPATAAGTKRPPVREEVATFLRSILPRISGSLPGSDETAKPRKSIEFYIAAPSGARVFCRIHFGGYVRELWSPIIVGVLIVASDTAQRNLWIERFRSEMGRLPEGTTVRDAGPRTVEVHKTVAWASPSELDEALAESVANDFRQFAEVLRSVCADGLLWG